jgi:hypothetical protein
VMDLDRNGRLEVDETITVLMPMAKRGIFRIFDTAAPRRDNVTHPVDVVAVERDGVAEPVDRGVGCARYHDHSVSARNPSSCHREEPGVDTVQVLHEDPDDTPSSRSRTRRPSWLMSSTTPAATRNSASLLSDSPRVAGSHQSLHQLN